MFFIRQDSPLSRPETAGKVIKAADWCAYQSAQEALARANARAAEIVDAALLAREEEMRRGHAEGREQAQREMSGNMVELANQTTRYYGQVERQMVDLVLDAVRKVVSEFDDRERVSTVVRNCLELVRTQRQLSINVHPAQVDHLRGEVAALQEAYPSIARIDVHPDPKLGLDACVVESEIGIVEASLSGQVEVLRSTLAAVFEQHQAAQ